MKLKLFSTDKYGANLNQNLKWLEGEVNKWMEENLERVEIIERGLHTGVDKARVVHTVSIWYNEVM